MDPSTPAAPAASSLPSPPTAATSPRRLAAVPGGPRRWPSLLVLLALVAFFAPAYVRHARLSADPAYFNDDARQQIWPFLRYHDDQLFRDDAIADYYLACFPTGYKLLYAVTGQVADPRAVSKVLPYLLLAITVWAAARAARRLRGPPAGWAAAALCLGGSLYLSRMSGGLPRSFALPLLAAAALALARGRPLMLVVVTILAAGFYPAAAVVCGLCLAAWLLVLPAAARGNAEAWGLGRRIATVAATALLAVLVLLPTQLASRQWGPVLGPRDAKEYAELSDAGRYQLEDRADRAFSLQAMKNFVEAPLAGLGGVPDPSARAGLKWNLRHIWLLVLLAVGLAGFAVLLKPSPPARRVLLLPVVAGVAYVVAVPLAPLLYLPARYQLYPLAIAALVMVPAGIAHLSTVLFKHAEQRRVQSVALLATVGLYVIVFSAWRIDPAGATKVGLSDLSTAGLERQADDHPAAYAFLAKQDRLVTLVAGWPTSLDDVPYVTARRALATRETHQAFHRQYAELMRKRVRAVIDALYDRDPASLVRLRNEFGVTHLVVDRGQLYGPKPPAYFAPFGAYAAEARAKLGTAEPAALQEADRAAVFTDGKPDGWIILALDRVR